MSETASPAQTVSGRIAADIELSIVLPAYREAESLRTLLPALRAAAASVTTAFEIVVVDAVPSLDETPAVCAAEGVRYQGRRGGNRYGDAVRTGIAVAAGRYVLFMDADGSHSPDVVGALWSRRTDGDIIIGSRYVSGGRTENDATLVVMSHMVNLAFRAAYRLPCKDVTNSLRLYRRDVLCGLTLSSNDFDIVEEMLIKAVAGPTRATTGEVPIAFRRRVAGESKRRLIPFCLAYLRTLVRLRRYRRAA